MERVNLAAGRYFIGDPCYVIRDKNWDEVCKFDEDGGIYRCLRLPFFMASTAFGDGTYYDQSGHEYGVDSGCLGAVPMEMVDEEGDLCLGRVVDFPAGLYIEYDGRSFDFGSLVVIDTNPEEDEDDEDDLGTCG